MLGRNVDGGIPENICVYCSANTVKWVEQIARRAVYCWSLEDYESRKEILRRQKINYYLMNGRKGPWIVEADMNQSQIRSLCRARVVSLLF